MVGSHSVILGGATGNSWPG